MEREPARQQHDLDRHHRHGAPRHLAEQGERDAGEDIAARGPAMGENGFSRAQHMGGVGGVADQLQGIVGFDAGADVEVAALVERPAAVVGLAPPQIDGDLVVDRLVDLAEEMAEQHIFRGNGRIRLEFEAPMAVLMLRGLEVRGDTGDDLSKIRRGRGRRPFLPLIDVEPPFTVLPLVEAGIPIVRHHSRYADRRIPGLSK